MRRRIANALIPLVAMISVSMVGCVSPIVTRLDEANARAALVNQQLDIATAQSLELKKSVDRSGAMLEEANKSLAKLDEANKTLAQMESHIADMDKKFTTIEAGFRKLTGVKAPEKED
jgi:hypothetical protein